MGHEFARRDQVAARDGPRPGRPTATVRQLRRLGVRASLEVGAVDDPAEREAERTARAVVAHLGGAGIGGHATSSTRIRRRSAPADPAAGPDGGPTGAALSGRIRAMSGGGEPLAAGVRAPLEDAFGADFSAVRVHGASELAPELGATAFTHGHDVHFAPGTFDPSSVGGLHLLAHELTHVVQNGDAGVSRSPSTAAIRRHASFEHLMLGQVDPADLRSIPDERAQMLQLGDGQQRVDVKMGNAYHVLRQERTRLRAWQVKRPQSLADVEKDWQVHAVEIVSTTAAEGPASTICTYGEMNMLADYFGSPEEVRAAEADTLFQLLQTERAEYYDKLGEMLNELMAHDFVIKTESKKGWFGGVSNVDVKWFLPEGAPEKDHYDPADYTVREGSARLTEQEFEGDQRHGVAKADLISMNGLENTVGVPGLLPTDRGLANFYGPDRGTGTAWGVTARNACHFAPESWRTWEQHHRKAIALAAVAASFRDRAAAEGTTPDEAERYLAEADRTANDAWVANGFADHFLQDSFASGHLVNKTLVMQWYMEDIKTWYSGPPRDLFQRYLRMSESEQPQIGHQSYSKAPRVAATNPQASANTPTLADAWQASGLVTTDLSPDAKQLLRVMRANSDRAEPQKVWGPLSGLKSKELHAATTELADGGFVITLPAINEREGDRTQVDSSQGVTGGKPVSDAEASAKSVTFNLYHEWLQSAIVQAGAGALHDHFCAQGLWVTTGNGEQPFKIYGDDKMLTAGAGDGVAYAAATARLSQANIAAVVQGGSTNDAEAGLATILDRLPSHIVPDFQNAATIYNGKKVGLADFQPPTAAPISIANWHDNLKAYTKGKYLKSLFDQWSHNLASQAPGQGGLVPFQLVSPHAGAEF